MSISKGFRDTLELFLSALFPQLRGLPQALASPILHVTEQPHSEWASWQSNFISIPLKESNSKLEVRPIIWKMSSKLAFLPGRQAASQL